MNKPQICLRKYNLRVVISLARRRVIFISGGGPRIAHSIGVLWAMLQMGITYDLLVCVSTGALIPIFIENGKSLEELLQFVTKAFSRKSEFALTNGLLFDAQAFVEQLNVKTSSAHVVATCNSTIRSKIFSLNDSLESMSPLPRTSLSGNAFLIS